MQLGLGPHDAGHVSQRAFEYCLKKKRQGVQGLLLGGGRDVIIDCEMGQKGGGLGLAQLLGLATDLVWIMVAWRWTKNC